MVLDIAGYSKMREVQQDAVLDRVVALLDEGVRIAFPNVTQPWSEFARWNVGDGYYVVFRGAKPDAALRATLHLCHAVEARSDPDVDALIRLRVVMGHGEVDTVTERGGIRHAGEVLVEVTRLLDGEVVRSALQKAAKPYALGSSEDFHAAWNMDRDRDRSLEAMWREFSIRDKHGGNWTGFLFGQEEGDDTEPAQSDDAAERERQHNEWLQTVRRRTAYLIGTSRLARERLTVECSLAPPPEPAWNQSLADALLDMKFDRTMRVLERTFKALEQEGHESSANAIRDIVRWLAPAMFQPDLVGKIRQIRDRTGQPIVAIETASLTAAELILAGVRSRALDYLTWSPEQSEFRSEFSLELPPETGADSGTDELVEAFVSALITRFAPAHAKKRFDRKGQIRVVVEHLKQQAERGNIWCVFIYADRWQSGVEMEAVRQIKEQFPDLMFIELDDDPELYAHETGVLWALRVVERAEVEGVR